MLSILLAIAYLFRDASQLFGRCCERLDKRCSIYSKQPRSTLDDALHRYDDDVPLSVSASLSCVAACQQ